MKAKLIAPCGMNCSLCSAYLREKNRCPGCRIKFKDKSKYRTNCVIKNCVIRKKKNLKYCSRRCEVYPCRRLKNLDKRYRTKYGMSMLENLQHIQEHGIRRFLEKEKKKWIKGGKVFCVHKKEYYGLK